MKTRRTKLLLTLAYTAVFLGIAVSGSLQPAMGASQPGTALVTSGQ